MSFAIVNYTGPDVRIFDVQTNMPLCGSPQGTEELIIDEEEGEWD